MMSIQCRVRGTLLAVAFSAFSAPSYAELPSVKLQTAPLVAPTQAWLNFGPSTTHTVGVGATGIVPPELLELSNAFSQGGTCTGTCYASLAYQYVRNNIAMEFRFGLGKGARGALIDQSGTAFDQAQLFVALLRQVNISANYQVGTVTLTGAEFQQWTGISSALGACQYLADGGIPATVNDYSVCGAPLTLTTAVTTVKMGHIWVSAFGNLYDPSYKIHVVKAGIGSTALAGALGCTTIPCSTGVLNRVPASTPSAIAGVNQIQNVLQGDLEGQLKTYAMTLEAYIRTQNTNNYLTANPSMQVEDLLGGTTIDLSQALPVPSNPLQTPLAMGAYTANSNYLWTGEIPDQFRTKLTVQFGPTGSLAINQPLYADEIAGSRLRLVNAGTNQTTSSTTVHTALYAESMLLAAGNIPNQTGGTIPLTLIITHPYAQNAYPYTQLGYASEQLLFNATTISLYCSYPPTNVCTPAQLWHPMVITIVQGLGNASETSIAHYAALSLRDQTHTPPLTLSPQNPSITSADQLYMVRQLGNYCGSSPPSSTPTSSTGCDELHQSANSANWLVQGSRVLAIAAGVNGTATQIHHSLGIVDSGNGLQAGGTVISVQTSMSVNVAGTGGATADRTSTFVSAAAALSRLEGSVFEQASDAWDSGSAVTLMAESNHNGTNGIAYYDITPSNVAATMTGGSPNANLSSYGSFYTTDIKPYVDAGGEVILPQQATPGTVACGTPICYTPSYNGFVAFGSNSDRVTYATNAAGFDKGATGAPDPAAIIKQQTTVQEYSVKQRKFLTVDPGSGEVNLAPPPDLVTGVGEFPLSLSYQRVYSSSGAAYACMGGGVAASPCKRAAAEISGLPMGWTHTLAISARLTNDGLASLGRNSALDASAVIAAMFTMRQLNVSTRTFPSNVATIFVANWIGSNLVGNVVAVHKPPATLSFVRLPDDSFDPQPGVADQLVQTGLRSPSVDSPTGVNWRNADLSFALTGKGGDVLSFRYAVANNPPSTSGPEGTFYDASSWSFPTGIMLTFTYGIQSVGAEGVSCLTSVSNNIGRSLSFRDLCPHYQPNSDPPVDPPNVMTITDESARNVTVAFLPSTLTGSANCIGCSPYMVSDLVAVTGMTVTAADGVAISEYDYVSRPTTPIYRSYYRVGKWLTPGDRVNAFEAVGFDSLFRATKITDNRAASCCTTNYWLSGMLGSEYFKLANISDPLAETTTKYLDRWNSLLQEVTPLGEVHSYGYDTFRRKISETLPELNGSQFTYDIRHNLLSTIRNAKPGSGFSATTVSTSYMGGPTQWPCINIIICNKPYQSTDARLSVTTYSWDTTKGVLTNIQYPAVPEGTPNTGLAYSTCTVGTNAPITVLSTKTERVWPGPMPAAQNLVTQYGYISTQNCNLTSVVIDPAGKALTTTLTFDLGAAGPGNITSIRDPNLNATGYQSDSLRRLIEVDFPLNAKTLYTYDLDGLLTSTQRWDSTRSAYQTEVRGYLPTGELAYIVGPNANPVAPAQRASTTLAWGSPLPCPGSFTSCYSYDNAGRKVLEQVPLTASTTRNTSTVYDANGRVTCEFRGWGSTVPAVATNCANWNPAAYAGSGAVRYSFMPQANFSLNAIAIAGYSANGKVTAILDANNNLTTNVYDGFDRLSQMVLPGGSNGVKALCHSSWTAGDNCEVFGYDANDNLLTKQNRSGAVIVSAWDAMNRERSTTVPNNAAGHFSRTLAKTYDLMGHVKTSSVTGADTQTLTNGYDTAIRVTSVQDSLLGTSNYSLDADGNRTALVWPGSTYTVTFAYDALHRLCKAKESVTTTCAAVDAQNTLIAQLDWDTLSRRSTKGYGNGVNESWGYANDSAIGSIAHSIGAKSIGLSFDHNQVEQITRQLVTVVDSTNGISSASFLYKPTTSASTPYVTNFLNQYATVGGISEGFDVNGNLTSDGTYAFEYDEENRLRSATGPYIVAYHYDPSGRRQSKTVNGVVTQFLSEGEEEVAEYSGSGAAQRYYVNGHDIDEHLAQVEAPGVSGIHYYYSTNHQGTVLAATDGALNVTPFNYGAYGESSSPTSGAAFRYTGRRLDPETGLYYYRARYYSPQLGRFLQTDPVGYKADLDLYAYVGNDPVDRTDPSGNTEVDITVERTSVSAHSTQGTITASNGKQSYSAHSLEPPGKADPKGNGTSSMKAGTYSAYVRSAESSSAHKYDSIQLKGNIPGKDGKGHQDVQVHRGNTPSDTKGCVVVGTTQGANSVGHSETALNGIMGVITATQKADQKSGETTTIKVTIRDPPPPEKKPGG